MTRFDDNKHTISWSFRDGLSSWSTAPDVTRVEATVNGVILTCRPPDSWILSPPISKSLGPYVSMTVTMQSNADFNGNVYFGKNLTERDSVPFVVIPDGKLRSYTITLPALDAGSRIRLDPTGGAGRVTVLSVTLSARQSIPIDAWARPSEMKHKKLIGGGHYTTAGDNQVNSAYLARHPEFITRYPYDGIVLSAAITLGGSPYPLHTILWNTVPITDATIAPVVKDLNTTRWQHLTDNFLNFSLNDGMEGSATPDFTKDADWKIVESNARHAARLCRKAKLKGFWLDTEQYSNYTGTETKFPFGRDTDTVLQQRGSQWIRAVQQEFPAIKIMITFAWCSEQNTGFMRGVPAFLNGILEGIIAPGEIHHTYENTFYFGQGPGTSYANSDNLVNGYPGDRNRYRYIARSIRAWRDYSNNPQKYDHFVKTGMAAWIEDDPWNNWSGSPTGYKWTMWSNAALALAYTDTYVWVWSEHTNYAHGLDEKHGINPFLGSLANATHNTGREVATTLDESFGTDPITRFWTFDFDMLKIGMKVLPQHDVLLMRTETIPYRWEASAKAVRVSGNKPTGLSGQRMRYVRAVRPIMPRDRFYATFDLRVEGFPKPGSPPILLGLFNTDNDVSKGLGLGIAGPDNVRFGGLRLRLAEALRVGVLYSLTLRGEATGVHATLSRGGVTLGAVITTKRSHAPLTEIGAALEDNSGLTPSTQLKENYLWWLHKVTLRRG